jgi:hypothetical protein
MSKSSRFFLLIPLIPTVIYVLSLLFYPNRDVLILWRREFNAPLEALLPLIISVLVYVVLALLLARRVKADQPLSRAQRGALIVLSIVGGLAIQWSVTRVTETDPLVGIAWRTYAIKSNGYWSVGAQVQDVASFIGEYPQHATDYPVHPMRHPPALSLVFWFGAQAFKLAPSQATPIADWLRPYSCLSNVSTLVPANQMASGAFGAALEIVLAMLTVLPLYGLVKRLAGTQAAVWAVLLYPLTPGFGMWVAQFDRSFALAAILVLYLCEDIVTKNSYRNAFLAGLVLSVASFASFGNLPIGLFAAIYVLVRIFQTQPLDELRHLAAWRSRIIQAALAVLGTASIWVLAYLLFGLNPFDLYHVIMQSHLSIDFPYWPFVVWNPWDIMTFIGLPLVAITIFAGWKRALPLTAAFCITLFALSVLGVARAETGRVWLFFTPLAVGAAAIVLVRRKGVEQTVVVGLLAVQLVVQASVMRVLNDYGYTPAMMAPVTVPADATQIDTRFGASGQIALLAYQLGDLQPGGYHKITLYWQRKSPEPIDTAYKVFIHVATDQSDQGRITSSDTAPVDWLYPTTCWQPEQIVADEHPLVVPQDAKPGDYPVFVGLYDPVSKVRPPTFASPPAQQMYGSILLPEPAHVVEKNSQP